MSIFKIIIWVLPILCIALASAQDLDKEVIQCFNSIDNPDNLALSLIPCLEDDNPEVRLVALVDIILTESKRPEVLQAEKKLLYSEPPGEFRDLLELGIEVSGGNTYTGIQAPGAKTPLVIGSMPTDSLSPGAQGGCYRDPATGEITCVDSYGEPTSSEGGMHGGCYRDPMTGEITCVDSYGGLSGSYEEPTGSYEQPSGFGGEMQGGCNRDPATGEITCVDSYGEPSGAQPQGGLPRGCYHDPETGQYVCVD